jgi:hypothetical protein
MNLKRLLCPLLSLLLILSATLLAGCNSTPDNAPSENEEQATTDYTLANIRNTIGSYTVIRAENVSPMIKNLIVELRTGIGGVAGVKPDVAEDWVEEKKSDLEILIGQTNRPESAQAMKALTSAKPYDIVQVGTKICIVGLDDYALRRAVYQFLGVHMGAELPEREHHNVLDFGAEGDGEHDDTDAFIAAIAAAKKDKLPVYVPAGTYKVEETLTLEDVTLYGYHSGTFTSDTASLPTILHTNLAEPLFHVVGGSLSGLYVDVKGVTAKGETEEGDPMVETVRLSKPGSRISNLKIQNPYIGIATQFTSGPNPGRCFIENIFIIGAYNTGVFVHGTYDVATLSNIEVWNPDLGRPCPTAYRFGKNDDLRAVNLFTFNSKVGFMFEETEVEGGKFEGCWGSFTNCSTDLCETGLKVGRGQHALTVIGGTYWNHFYGLDVTSQTSDLTRITMTGCELKTNGASTVNVAGGQMVTVTGCNISRTQSDHKAIPVTIKGGTGVTLSGNTICANGTAAVEIASTFKGAATVTGNTVITSQNSADGALSNKSQKGVVIFDSNAVLTSYKHK